MVTVLFVVAGLLVMLGPIIPLEDECNDCRSNTIMGWGNPGKMACHDRLCSICGRSWRSGDPFAFRLMARRLEGIFR